MGDCPQIGVISYFNKTIWFAHHFYELRGTYFSDYTKLSYEHINVIFVYLYDKFKDKQSIGQYEYKILMNVLDNWELE